MTVEIEYLVDGVNGQLTITSDGVSIARKGFQAILMQGVKPEKSIAYDDIASVELKKAGIFTNGFLRFVPRNARDSTISVTRAVSDADSIVFSLAQQPRFLRAVKLVETHLSGAASSRNAATEVIV
jgi:hypothetical protein